jgi:hypothetical protein
LQPEDWDDKEYIPDPEDVKPEVVFMSFYDGNYKHEFNNNAVRNSSLCCFEVLILLHCLGITLKYLKCSSSFYASHNVEEINYLFLFMQSGS